MIATEKLQTEALAFWTVLLLVVLLISGYGQQLISWVLQKLYDFFIGGNNSMAAG